MDGAVLPPEDVLVLHRFAQAEQVGVQGRMPHGRHHHLSAGEHVFHPVRQGLGRTEVDPGQIRAARQHGPPAIVARVALVPIPPDARHCAGAAPVVAAAENGDAARLGPLEDEPGFPGVQAVADLVFEGGGRK